MESLRPCFLADSLNQQVRIYENNNTFHTINTFVYFTPNDVSLLHAFLAYFASPWFSLYLEKNAHPMGGGALSVETIDYKNSPVPNFKNLSKSNIEKMKKAWCNYREDFDQKKLDSVVLKILGFTAEEIKQIGEETRGHSK